MIEFFLPMKPPTVTLQSKLVDSRTHRVYDSATLADAKARLDAFMGQKAQELQIKSLRGSLRLTVFIGYALKGRHYSGEPYTNKPDWDNATKLIQDSLGRAGFFVDDKQIVEAHITQSWQGMPGIYVKLEEIDA